ncbi:YheC/YheD family protein [Desertibacillus haloalkaliphilus]|uniref:YheC/YheD family protein n=1 Tax=Desertibacillus haloalkaliphilus TaxID=1328930 RepID=UPI001C27F2FE|nr:YheC/YheD family protein [Desertibacillus haloalkaliphilus]MBU8907649.1 YheC/YheD family protein [Desertibacillus haloalkaliphilus]
MAESKLSINSLDTEYERYVGKWRKYTLMKQKKKVRQHLPKTKLFSKKSLWKMLDKYGEVIVKPSYGKYGRKVAKISCMNDGKIKLHMEQKKKVFCNREEAYTYLSNSYLNGKCHIIQQYIPLATINECPFDLRVMVQRKKESDDWMVTGVAAKVAASGFAVTNVAKQVLNLETAIEQSNIVVDDKCKLIEEMNKASVKNVQSIQDYYPEYRGIGLDVGVDPKGDIWIIEANLEPTIDMFMELNDRSALRKIRAYNRG